VVRSYQCVSPGAVDPDMANVVRFIEWTRLVARSAEDNQSEMVAHGGRVGHHEDQGQFVVRGTRPGPSRASDSQLPILTQLPNGLPPPLDRILCLSSPWLLPIPSLTSPSYL
jgi:hypothetical protein